MTSLFRVTAGVTGLMALTACGPQFARDYGMAPESRRQIEVALPLSTERAMTIVQEAAVKGGWTVAQAFPGAVSLVPYRPPANRFAMVTLRANIVGADSARVVFSGTVTNEAGRVIAGTYAVDEPITEANRGGNLVPWEELSRFAETVLTVGGGRVVGPPIPRSVTDSEGRRWQIRVKPAVPHFPATLQFHALNGEVREIAPLPTDWATRSTDQLLALLSSARVTKRGG